MSLHECKDPNCDRSFLDVATLAEHAEAVHTFNDIRQLVSDAVRAKWGNVNAPAGQKIYTYVADLSDDWVVFEYEDYNPGNPTSLQKASYTIDASNNVTLGEPVEVVRKTIYEPVKPAAPAAPAPAPVATSS